MTPIFSKEERQSYWDELCLKFRSGVRSAEGVVYIVVTLVAVAWASWGIPSINNSETSPETLGIFVIGLLISVMLDALIVAWKHKSLNSSYETAVLVTAGLSSFIMIVFASYFSIKPLNLEVTPHQREGWKEFAMPALLFFLAVSIVLSLIVSGMDSSKLNISAIDSPVEVENK